MKIVKPYIPARIQGFFISVNKKKRQKATYWNVGRRIVEEEQHGEERAKYETKLIAELAKKLIPTFGNNYGKRNLLHYRKFYILFPDFGKVYEFVHNLNWSRL